MRVLIFVIIIFTAGVKVNAAEDSLAALLESQPKSGFSAVRKSGFTSTTRADDASVAIGIGAGRRPGGFSPVLSKRGERKPLRRQLLSAGRSTLTPSPSKQEAAGKVSPEKGVTALAPSPRRKLAGPPAQDAKPSGPMPAAVPPPPPGKSHPKYGRRAVPPSLPGSAPSCYPSGMPKEVRPAATATRVALKEGTGTRAGLSVIEEKVSEEGLPPWLH